MTEKVPNGSSGRPSRIATWGARATEVLGSRWARATGFVVGLGALGLLLVAFRSAGARGADAVRDAGPAPIALAFVAFLVFHGGSTASLALIGGRPALRLWSAAQVAKYLPAPGAGLAGVMQASVAEGKTVGYGIKITVRHTGVLLGGAIAAGSPALGHLAGDRAAWSRWPVTLAVAALALAGGYAAARGSAARDRVLAVLLSTGTWAALAAGLYPLIDRGGVPAAAAFPIAWAVGLLALPVPAGIGVREVVLVGLLSAAAGDARAVAFAVVTRLLQVASDGVVGIVAFGVRHGARARREPTLP